jgi:hypothetical protein
VNREGRQPAMGALETTGLILGLTEIGSFQWVHQSRFSPFSSKDVGSLSVSNIMAFFKPETVDNIQYFIYNCNHIPPSQSLEEEVPMVSSQI